MAREEREEGDEVRMVPAESRTDQALDLAAQVAGALDLALPALDIAVPGLGGAVGAVLGGIGTRRRMERVAEVVNQLALDLHEFRSDAAEGYVRTDDFQELLEKALRQAADERSDEKRRIVARFLAGALTSPCEPGYDEQLRFLRVLEELQPDHLHLLMAIDQPPRPEPMTTGQTRQSISPLKVLSLRFRAKVEGARLEELVRQLTIMGVTNFQKLPSTFRGHEPQNLAPAVTPFGRRFLRFLAEPAR